MRICLIIDTMAIEKISKEYLYRLSENHQVVIILPTTLLKEYVGRKKLSRLEQILGYRIARIRIRCREFEVLKNLRFHIIGKTKHIEKLIDSTRQVSRKIGFNKYDEKTNNTHTSSYTQKF